MSSQAVQKYDPTIHIHIDDISIMTGMTGAEIRSRMRSDPDSPKGVGVAIPKRVKLVIWDRAEVLRWVDAMPKPERVELVQPSDINLMTRAAYEPCAAMRIAIQRSSVQPRLMSMTSNARPNFFLEDR